MAELPAFLFYPEDFATGTADMSPVEVGIYIRCLCHQWHKGSVPDDATKVARIAGASTSEIEAAWPSVRSKFTVGAQGALQNARLEKVRAELRASQRRRSKSGKAGAAARWKDAGANGKRNASAMPSSVASSCESDGKTMPSRVEDEDRDEDSLCFEDFWKVVPRKEGRVAAEIAYAKAASKIAGRSGPGGDDPDAFLVERMAAFAKSPRGKAGKHCPHPTTWLNQGRYDDDPAAWKLGGDDRDPRGTLDAAREFLEMADG